jgi:hypothetical protein
LSTKLNPDILKVYLFLETIKIFETSLALGLFESFIFPIWQLSLFRISGRGKAVLEMHLSFLSLLLLSSFIANFRVNCFHNIREKNTLGRKWFDGKIPVGPLQLDDDEQGPYNRLSVNRPISKNTAEVVKELVKISEKEGSEPLAYYQDRFRAPEYYLAEYEALANLDFNEDAEEEDQTQKEWLYRCKMLMDIQRTNSDGANVEYLLFDRHRPPPSPLPPFVSQFINDVYLDRVHTGASFKYTYPSAFADYIQWLGDEAEAAGIEISEVIMNAKSDEAEVSYSNLQLFDMFSFLIDDLFLCRFGFYDRLSTPISHIIVQPSNFLPKVCFLRIPIRCLMNILETLVSKEPYLRS